MLFFRIEGTVRNRGSKGNENNNSRGEARRVALKSDDFNEKHSYDSYYFVSECIDDVAVIGAITENCEEPKEELYAFINAIGYELEDIKISEVTITAIRQLLEGASRKCFLSDKDELLKRYGFDKLSGHWHNTIEFGENLIIKGEKNEIIKNAERYMLCDTLIPELERIYCGSSVEGALGHPVHYIVETDDFDVRRESCRLLLQALYSNRRISSRRYCFLDFKRGESFSGGAFETLYKICFGGAVIIRYINGDDSEDNGYADSELETIENICEVVRKYKNQVLTILCLARESTKVKRMFHESLCNMSFIELREEMATGDKARSFLKMLANDSQIEADSSLWECIEEGKSYLVPELHCIFDEWYNNKLKTDVYPQYKNFDTVKKEYVKELPKGSAYDELCEMIGLNEAKSVIQKALNYYKIQKLFADKGFKKDNPAMHMIFTGNPGTAKTTVARLFANIMKDNGLLTRGHLVEVGRGDLVGKYVGWTAKTVQNKFRAAMGGVLFIDEAYSLVDDRDGSFGDEAINTIVQEMENHREDVVVIFAGYPDKMGNFLDKNPGLRSRIAFHVSFADYSTDELCAIAESMGKKKGIHFDNEAMRCLEGVFADARKRADFGNGRYVRNLIEQVRMNQASRLIEYNIDDITVEEITTIKAVDITIPEIKREERRAIGFGGRI